MRYLIAICGALATISTSAIAEAVPASMSWEYRGADANVTVVLKANGECAVLAALARGGGAHVVECTYSVREPYVWLNWKHEIYGLRPFPSRLMLVGDGEFMRIDGESQRVLRRTTEQR